MDLHRAETLGLQQQLDGVREVDFVVDDQRRSAAMRIADRREAALLQRAAQARRRVEAAKVERLLDALLQLAVEPPHRHPRLVVGEIRLDVHLVVRVDREEELARHEVLLEHELHERVVAIAEAQAVANARMPGNGLDVLLLEHREDALGVLADHVLEVGRAPSPRLRAVGDLLVEADRGGDGLGQQRVELHRAAPSAPRCGAGHAAGCAPA